ncbi:MAG: thiol peroxidase [Bacteroides sp.]|nr:thiol peroxidase [Bacteroidales bacterium]MBD5205923.1 thiol peroxidase [Bacteroidales bacterium]MBD5222670.1 thiol peroxidase [Bacteroidales bacterium]MBD5302019.1 thiol peroxidase [Bacteroides sp.]MBD5305358.1 thiol peroxidase [Bacteroides sp.]
MEKLTMAGNECHTCGNTPKPGEEAPGFTLTGKDLNEVKLDDYRGKKVVLNIFPSLDTPVCAASVRRFNKEASEKENVTVLCISQDLPFAMGRFCTAEGLENVTVASSFRSPEFGEKYGLTIVDGPLRGLLARCVIIVNESGKVEYVDLVREITNEPNYDAALAKL